jgi:uncharacterized protein
MLLPITLLTTSILLLVFLALTVRVLGARQSSKIVLGTGSAEVVKIGDAYDGASLLARTRAHANFAEFVPISLLALALLELHKASHWLIVGAAVSLVAARVAHGIGMNYEAPNPWRFGGAAVQFAWLGIVGIYGVLLAF